MCVSDDLNAELVRGIRSPRITRSCDSSTVRTLSAALEVTQEIMRRIQLVRHDQQPNCGTGNSKVDFQTPAGLTAKTSGPQTYTTANGRASLDAAAQRLVRESQAAGSDESFSLEPQGAPFSGHQLGFVLPRLRFCIQPLRRSS
jgi:hypothetical protein